MPRGIPRSTQAKNNPVIMSGQTFASEQDIGQGGARTINKDANGKPELSPQMVVVAERVYDSEKMAMLAFNNELVTIKMAQTNDKNAEQKFEININGRPQLFMRGATYTVPRYFVDRLMRLKQTVYDQEEYMTDKGERKMRYPARTALKYDFAIVRDDHPRAKEWERAILAEV